MGRCKVGGATKLVRRRPAVVTPTYLIFTAQGDQDIILGASALYLFGFTYLYVALNLAFDLDTTGCGFFCAFVVVCALVFSGLNFGRLHDTAFVSSGLTGLSSGYYSSLYSVSSRRL